MTDSMSSPTYPACVSAVQSQIANGTSKQRAIVWARSVLPGEKEKRYLNDLQTQIVSLQHTMYICYCSATWHIRSTAAQ